MNKVLIALGIILICVGIRFATDLFDTPVAIPQVKEYKIGELTINGMALYPSEIIIESKVTQENKVLNENIRTLNTNYLSDQNVLKIKSTVEGNRISIFDDINYLLNISPLGTEVKNINMVSEDLISNLEKLNFENYGILDQNEVDGLKSVDVNFNRATDIIVRDPALSGLSSFYDKDFSFADMDKSSQTFAVDTTYTHKKNYQWISNTDSSNVLLVCNNFINEDLYRSDSLWYNLKKNIPVKMYSISSINDSINIHRISSY